MTAGQERESILAADCGSNTTGVALIDRVDGDYRFVACGEISSSFWPPVADVTVGVRQAVYRIEEIVGRQLMAGDGKLLIPEQSSGEGVDAFVATASAAPPLRVMVAALGRDLSLSSAQRAVESTYSVLEEVMVLAGEGKRWGDERGAEAKIEDIYGLKPDVILIAGGFDGGAVAPHEEIAHIVATACSLLEPADRPEVIFAGNKEARPVVAERLADDVSFRVVENVRPGLESESLSDASRELEEIYQQKAMAKLPGFADLASLSMAPILPTSSAFGLVIHFISRQYEFPRILGVDVGDTSTHLVSIVDGELHSSVRGGLGMGRGIVGVRESSGYEGISRWLPHAIGSDEVANWLMNKSLRPWTIPQLEQDHLLEQAAAREAMRLAADGEGGHGFQWRMKRFDLVVGRGRVLSCATQPGQAALMLMDALQPVGVAKLALDRLNLVPQLGAAAIVHPVAAAQVLERDAFARLGTLIAPLGSEKEGEMALKFRLRYADESTLEGEIPFGSIEVLPLEAGERAVLELRPSRKLDIGLGVKGKGASVEVEGGLVGVILDVRGRPIAMPSDEGKRQESVARWMRALGF
jgi:hypothetical protein